MTISGNMLGSGNMLDSGNMLGSGNMNLLEPTTMCGDCGGCGVYLKSPHFVVI